MIKNDAYNLADTVQMKKPHACQKNDWEILRLGADIKLKCMGCGHVVMLPRAEFNRKVKKVLTKANDPVNLKKEHYLPKDQIARPNIG
ncbi:MULTISPECIES: DUF951 domain-containing protein [Lactobacillus]|uniref:DUF951 domain-containing protein n=1 Tax=Lactobacillus xujianguonis TaxID=2495899 RepID=A0A437SU79_9LACO|nr:MULTISPECIES: DUF951 domain-containing protein [Lactobacillus]RVU70456.1 DUF951 domain-containing protein [Lactobacillus xujianguonis]RVU73141.1 DUF951 domain-containing protein [Lactobacillus xujianguonis]